MAAARIHVPALDAEAARQALDATGLVLKAYSSEPPSVLVCTNARCAKSDRLSTISSQLAS
jgi:hypothetical protein